MGTDIHMFAEIRKADNWEKVGEIFKGWNHTPEKPTFSDEPYDCRHYDLFAILANVRNGSGFAGVKTGEGFNPISDPRGMPDDASSEMVNLWFHAGGHSESYLSLKELLEYDWGQITMKQGYMPYTEWLESKISGEKPNSYSADVGGTLVVKFDENEINPDKIDQLIKEGKSVYIKTRWSVLYSEVAAHFFESAIPQLKELGDPENVRIVFWFDS